MLFVVTIISSVPIRESTPEGQGKNNSFHRIYSNCEEELSDNSDCETSTFSNSYNSTARSRKCESLSVLNNSFSSSKSLNSPWMSSVNNLNHSFRSEFQRSPRYQQSNLDLFSENKHSDRKYFFPNGTISEPQRCSSMFGLNSSFRQTISPDDCQNKLTDLNISGTRHRNNNTITCSSPTPSMISLNRCRSQLLTPARLNFDSHSSLTAPATKTSWVAGGFFVKNGMSPQKRQQNESVLLNPILSRTSSQSSGFESRASSAHNGNANGSRESSIAGDAVSSCSEPTLIADSASQMGINDATNSMFNSTLPRPKPFFPVLGKNQATFFDSASHKPDSITNYSMYPWTNQTVKYNVTSASQSSQPIYHQFGTHRHSAHYNDSMFNKFPYHSPGIRKGSLLKLNDS